jgi:hypothetical protein
LDMSVTKAKLHYPCVTEEKRLKPLPVLSCDLLPNKSPLERTEIILTEEDLREVAL